jgi:hypothetical protein
MREFLAVYSGALVALVLMTVATLALDKAIRVVLSILAVLVLLAHAGLIVILIAIGSSGSVADAALAELRDRLVVFVSLTWSGLSCLCHAPRKTHRPYERREIDRARSSQHGVNHGHDFSGRRLLHTKTREGLSRHRSSVRRSGPGRQHDSNRGEQSERFHFCIVRVDL